MRPRWFLLLILPLLSLSLTAHAATVLVTWNAVTTNADDSPITDLARYEVHFGTQLGVYGAPMPVGLATQASVTGLTPGTTYWFTATAWDTSGNESAQAVPVSYTVPVPPPDTIPPTVMQSSVSDGAINVSPTSTLTVQFSEAMLASSIDGTTVRLLDAQGVLVPASVTYHSTTRTVSLDPTAALAAQTLYTFTLIGLTDLAGNPLASVSVQFTTGALTIPGLMLSYAANAGSGTALADTSGRNKTGILVNGVQWVQGVAGQGLYYDGQNDYVRTNSPQHPTGDWTWTLWIKPEVVSGWYGLMQLQTSASTGVELALTAGNLEVWYAGQGKIPPVGVIAVNEWSFVTLMRAGSTLRLYHNGQPVATASGATVRTFGTCPLLWGVDADSGCTGGLNGYFRGAMDDLRIYNRALTITELQHIMADPH